MKIIIQSENYQQIAKLLGEEPIFFVVSDDVIEEIQEIIFCNEEQFDEVVKTEKQEA